MTQSASWPCCDERPWSGLSLIVDDGVDSLTFLSDRVRDVGRLCRGRTEMLAGVSARKEGRSSVLTCQVFQFELFVLQILRYIATELTEVGVVVQKVRQIGDAGAIATSVGVKISVVTVLV